MKTNSATPRLRSQAILIGVSEYEDAAFPSIPAAFNNLAEIKRLLADPVVCGWPHDAITIVFNPLSPGALASRIDQLAQATNDVLLVYFVGHAKLDDRAELCLAVSTTQANRPLYTGVPYEWVARAIRSSAARLRIIILDCCFSGQAIEALSGEAESLADITHVDGVYTLTATTRNKTAHMPPADRQHASYTSFTGEFLKLLSEGIPDGSPHLTLDMIYRHVRTQLSRRGLPQPSQRGTETSSHYVFAKNVAASTVEPAASPNSSPLRQVPGSKILEANADTPDPGELTPSRLAAQQLADIGSAEASRRLAQMGPREASAVLAQMAPRRAANILGEMNFRDIIDRIIAMDTAQAAKIVSEIPQDVASKFLIEMTPPLIADLLSFMKPRRVATLLTELEKPSRASPVTPDQYSVDIILSIFDEMRVKTIAAVLPNFDFDVVHALGIAFHRMDRAKAAEAIVKTDRDTAGALLYYMDEEPRELLLHRVGRDNERALNAALTLFKMDHEKDS